MSFLVPCPNCGKRNVHEFRFGGEILARPKPEASVEEWAAYSYRRRNVEGEQREWIYHKFGCRNWFVAVRDTATNRVLESFWPDQVTR